MLLRGRIDYLIDLPFSFQMAKQKLPEKDRELFLFIPIEEEQKFRTGYAICNDIAESRTVIQRINEIILTNEFKEKVTKRLIDFLPKTLRQEYYRINLDLIGQTM